MMTTEEWPKYVANLLSRGSRVLTEESAFFVYLLSY